MRALWKIQVCRVLRLMACAWAITMPASSGTLDGRGAVSVARAAAFSDQRDGPVWVVDPAEPGLDRPPVGRSLFDYLITEPQGDRIVYRVPIPYTALVERIERELGADKRGSPLKRVLIPLNRSLQRHAAKPDPFVYPRAVVGVDSEPPLRAGFSGILLKDRLFLGYHEKAEILEVISYNEAAGRFEFQVVRDYAPGKSPKVLYANRALCTACHQNHSPIFSRPLWDETNANQAIAKLLQDRHANLYGVPIRQGIDVPDAIDQATDRANELSAYQVLWQEGCEQAGSPGDSIQCRAELFHFSLLSRLSGIPDLVDRVPSARRRVASHIAARWNDKWPQGLKIPNPDLPNRNPVDSEIVTGLPSEPGLLLSRYEAGERAKIRSMFEPTILREPLGVWSLSPDAAPFFSRAVTGLGGFLAAVDLERLDTFLARRGSEQAAPMHRYQSRCEGELRTSPGSPERVTFRCRAPEASNGKEHPEFLLEGVVYLNKRSVTGGTIERLSAGDGGALSDLEVSGGTITSANERYSGHIVVRQRQGRLQARLAEGHAVAGLAFEFSGARHHRRAGSRPTGLTGSATLTVRDDYAAVRRAIEAMARDTVLGESDVFARKPFRRAAVMKVLFKHLGMPPLKWCCDDADNMPPVNVLADPVLHDHERPLDGEPFPPALKAFDRYCVQCHHEDLAFPPNFLHGSPARIREQIRDCAERILFRLEMWTVPASARQEAPMPPATALRRLHLSPEEWAGHDDFRVLESYTKDLLASQSGKPVRLEDFVATGYDNLRACSSTRPSDQSESKRRHLGTTG